MLRNKSTTLVFKWMMSASASTRNLDMALCLSVDFKSRVYTFHNTFNVLEDVLSRAETNTSSTRLPGSSKYPNYPIAGIRIR